MKKLFYLFTLLLAISVTSCDKDDNGISGPENPGSQENALLEGTKWTSRTFDFDIADDISWGYAFTDIVNIYFYSSTEGVFYQSRKTLDSDNGSSRFTQTCFFKYSLKNGIVTLDNITPTTSQFVSSLNFRNNRIEYGGTYLVKDKISSQDKNWINEISGTSGSSRWYYDMHSTLCILGNGAMADYTSYSVTPWAKNRLEINSVIIGSNVTTLGSYAFANPSIGNLEFEGQNVTSIRKGAFEGTSIGGKIYLPDNIKIIGTDAFYKCKYAQLYLPSKIEEIEAGAFSGCKSVNMLNTPNLRKIGESAFLGTTIEKWTDSEILQVIGRDAVSDFNQSKISLNSIQELGSMAIVGTKLNEIHIGSSIRKISGTPFLGASSGKIYVNLSTPINITDDVVLNPGNWTLYVPKESENAFKSAPYWKNFKSVSGSTDLDNTNGSNDQEQPDNDSDFISYVSVNSKAFTAKISGSIPAQAYNQNSNYQIRYSLSYGLTTYKTANISNSNFNEELLNLEPNSIYYYMITALNSSGKILSTEIKTFTTSAPKSPSSMTYTIDGKEFKMVKVTGFDQGDFYIMQTELPVASIFVIDNFNAGKLDKNLNNIIIKAEFVEFMQNLRNATDIEFRLPSSAEWKYAAKGGNIGKGYTYAGSNDLNEVGWYKDNSDGLSHAPAKKKPNELGIYDMSGNLGEIVKNPSGDAFNVDGDIYGGYYSSTAAKCSVDSYIYQPTSGKIDGTSFTHKNAFEAKYYTVRLVYSASN